MNYKTSQNEKKQKTQHAAISITFIPFLLWDWDIKKQKKKFWGSKGWEKYSSTLTGTRDLYALRTGYVAPNRVNIIAIDCDKAKKPEQLDGIKLVKLLIKQDILNENTYVENSISGGKHYLFTIPDNVALLGSTQGVYYEGKYYACDIRCSGGLIFCAGSKLKIKKTIEDEGEVKYYTFDDETYPKNAEELRDRILKDIKPANSQLIKFFKTVCNETKPKETIEKITHVRNSVNVEKLSEYLDHIDPQKYGIETRKWRTVLYAINKLNNSVEMFEKFFKWSRKAQGYEKEPKENILKSWNKVSKLSNEKITTDINALYAMIRVSDIDYYRRVIYTELFNDEPQNLKNYVEFEEKYITNNKTFLNASKEWNTSRKTMILKSNLGTGKTTYLCKIADKYKRVLILTHRRTFAHMHFGNLENAGFKLYLKESDEKIFNADKLIISLEKLPSLIENMHQAFDLVVFDECESLLCHVSSSTLFTRGGDIQTLQNIRKLCIGANKILAMDAHISARSVEFLRSIDEEFIYAYNKYFDINRTVKFYNDSEYVRGMIFQYIREDKKIVIVCESKNDVEKLTADIMAMFPNKKIKSYTSSTPTSEKKELENVNKAWSDIDVLIYNSTIEAGLSYDNKSSMFHKMFCVCKEETNSPRGLVQQLLRIRQLEDNVITCDIGGKIKYTDVEKHVWTYDEVYTPNSSIDEVFNSVLTWNAVEHKNKDCNTFFFMFNKYLNASGFQVDTTCLRDENKTKSNKFNKKQQKEQRENILSRYMNYAIVKNVKPLEEKIKNGTETVEDIERKDIFYMTAADSVEFTDDNKEKAEEYLNMKLSHENIIKNAAELIEPKTIKPTTDIRGYPVNSIHSENMRKRNKMKRNILKLMEFNFDNSNDFVSKKEFENTIEGFVKSEYWQGITRKEFMNVMNIRDKQYKPFSDKDTLRSFSKKFNELFKNDGIKIVSMRKGKKMDYYFKITFDKHIDEFVAARFMRSKDKTDIMDKFIANTKIEYWSDIIVVKNDENYEFAD